jgi:UDP-glucose 4-epimerase
MGKSERVLVWGARGFIGRHLVEALLSRGYDVAVLARDGTPRELPAWEPRVDWHLYDASQLSVETAVRAIGGARLVFDLAGSSGAVASNREPAASLDANCRQHLEFLHACRVAGTRPHVVFASSRLVYAPSLRLPVDETAAVRPRSIYAVHKYCIEQYLDVYANAGSLTYTIARISNPFGAGEGQRDYGFINALIASARAGRPLRLFGNGRQLRDYIYIADLVDALVRCGEQRRAVNQIFNIGSGRGLSMVDAARHARARAGTAAPIEFSPWPDDYERVESGDYVADIRKATGVLGFTPRFDFDAGLDDMFGRTDSDMALATAAIRTPIASGRGLNADRR